MPQHNGCLIYESGQWQVHLGRRELLAHGVAVPIGPRAFEIIEVLVQSANELVTKYNLMDRIWPGAAVGENTLQVHISAIRKALGQDRAMLATDSGRGYRLLGRWAAKTEAAHAEPAVLAPVRESIEPTRGNLPMAATHLIGRDEAVHQIQDLLSAYRIVTLTGPGGIGKTALALEVSRGMHREFDTDVWIVELASLSDPDLLPSAIAGVLGLREGGDEVTAEAVADAVGDKPLLVILDNCEHVIDAAARLVETLVRRCPRMSVLATSQELLRVGGEYVYQVPPLAVPPRLLDEADDVLGHAAVRLFVTRIQALDSTFTAVGDNARSITAICRHLDGIPLAIEFAAARAATLGVQHVAAHLEDRFKLLGVGRRTALPRHQSLRAALDWSYELLPETERRLLSRLAIFAAGFTLEAATAVMNDTGVSAPAVLEGVANLVAKSLVTLDRSEPSGRWALLETIRAYAFEKLVESGDADATARRHAKFYRDLLEPADGSRSRFPIQDLTRYAREIDNVRAALGWAFSALGDPAIGVTLTALYVPVWLHSSFLAECHERTARALANPMAEMNLCAPLRMWLHLALGLSATCSVGSIEIAETALARALEIAETLDDQDTQLRILWAQYSIYLRVGRCHAARSTADQFTRVALRIGDPSGVPAGHRLVVDTPQSRASSREVQKRFERVLQFYIPPEDQQHRTLFQFDRRVLARPMLARVVCLQGFLDQAGDQARARPRETQSMDHGPTVCCGLDHGVCPATLTHGALIAADLGFKMLIDLAASLNTSLWKTVECCLRGKLFVTRGEFKAGTDPLRAELDVNDTTGWSIFAYEYAGVREGLAGPGHVNDAVTMADAAPARATPDGKCWSVAELLRIKGELLLYQVADGTTAAEECFLGAIGVARGQVTLFWELHAALGLARLRLTQDPHEDARQILAPIYARFIDASDVTDMRSARALPGHGQAEFS